MWISVNVQALDHVLCLPLRGGGVRGEQVNPADSFSAPRTLSAEGGQYNWEGEYVYMASSGSSQKLSPGSVANITEV